MDTPPDLPPPKPVAIELAWERAAGAEECIDEVTLAARLQGTLGRAVAVSSGRAADATDATDAADATDATAVSGRVAPLAGGRGWFAVVDVRRAGGVALHREVALDVPDCRELDAATVLVVALLVDAAVPRPPRLTLAPPPATTALAIGPDVTFAVGMLPGLAVGLGLAASIDPPGFWPIALWGHAWPAIDYPHDGFGGTFDAWTAGAGLCPRIAGHDRVALLACAGVSAGVVDSTGLNLDQPHGRSRPYVDVELDLGLRVPLARHFFVRVEVGGAVPLTRNDYAFVDAAGASRWVFRTAAVVPMGRVGLEVQAP